MSRRLLTTIAILVVPAVGIALIEVSGTTVWRRVRFTEAHTRKMRYVGTCFGVAYRWTRKTEHSDGLAAIQPTRSRSENWCCENIQQRYTLFGRGTASRGGTPHPIWYLQPKVQSEFVATAPRALQDKFYKGLASEVSAEAREAVLSVYVFLLGEGHAAPSRRP